MKLFNIVVGVAVAVGLMNSAAHAEGIVLESYTGDRPADAARLLAPFFEELSKRKVEAGEGVARKFDSQVSRPARSGQGLPADFGAQVEKGFKEWVGGSFDKAIKILVPLVENAHANSGQFAADPNLGPQLQKALTVLSIAQSRIGDQGAMNATMKELIRSFPNAQISTSYGRDAAIAFAEVSKEVKAQGTGKLSVDVTDKEATVFINENYRGNGSITVELPPGDYRVLVNKKSTRIHNVTVTANSTATVTIDVGFDLAVRTTGYTGLSYSTDEERFAMESQQAAAFARALDARSLYVVGIENVRGKPSLVGAALSLQGDRDLRRASVPLEPDPSNKQIANLAKYLSGEEAAPGVVVEEVRKATSAPKSGDTSGRRDQGEPVATTSNRWGGWRFLTGVLGVGGLVAGGILVALDGSCSMDPPQGQPCNDLYATATPGYVALGAGAVVTGVSIYLFATHKTVPVVQTAQTGTGATVGFMTRW